MGAEYAVVVGNKVGTIVASMECKTCEKKTDSKLCKSLTLLKVPDG